MEGQSMHRLGLLIVATLFLLSCESAYCDVTIRGRVVDAEGKPVSGAQVFWLGVEPINSIPPSLDGRANDEGEFLLTTVGVEPTPEILGRPVVVYAEGQGLGITTVGAILQQEEGLASVTLPPESDTAFRILDPDGHVLAGELVEPVLYVDGGVNKLPATFVQAIGRVSDDTGLVRFPALKEDRLRAVRVVSQTFGPQQLDRGWDQTRLSPTIRLRPAARVQASFDTRLGQMGKCKVLFLTMASVEQEPVPDAAGQGILKGAYAEFFENPRGFEIPALAAGTLRFHMSGCTNHEPLLPRWPVRPELIAGTTQKLVIPLERTVTIRGRVLEGDKPAAGAELFVYTRSAGCAFQTYADKDGCYSCNVLEGPTAVSASRRDPATRQTINTSSTIERVIGPEGLEFPDLVLTRPAPASR
jgi:hypothetical protein